jgi:hypothetical protein
MKRRFRALVRELLPEHGLAGHDHVLIGREGGVERDFALLRKNCWSRWIAPDRARAMRPAVPRAENLGRGKGPGSLPREICADLHRPPVAMGTIRDDAAHLPLFAILLGLCDRSLAKTWRD